MYLVMLETNGNQRFIFDSPRLRDAIGASFLLARLDEWTGDAYRTEKSEGAWECEDYEAACVSRSSGKVIVRVPDESAARALISAVTKRVVEQAPGMDVTGVYVKLDSSHVTGDDVKQVHEEAARYAVSRPPSQARFAQMPFLVRGSDSVFPASPVLGTFVEGSLPEAGDDRVSLLPLSRRVKRFYALHGREQFLQDMAKDTPQNAMTYANLRRDTNKLVTELERLERAFEGHESDMSVSAAEQSLTRVAVIHIDGNGIGAAMKELHSAMEELRQNSSVVEALKGIGVDVMGDDAFASFVKAVNERLNEAIRRACQRAFCVVARLQYPTKKDSGLEDDDVVHVVPVLLGGDDATVIVNGKYAIAFTVEFLRAFESLTEEDFVLREISDGKFTAGAGVAIVPTKFPFHLAYELAEHLASDAKTAGKEEGVSTFSYHQLVDTTILDAAALVAAYKRQSGQPFVVSTVPADSSLAGKEWSQMVRKTAYFMGLIPVSEGEEARPFPGARAQRMRRYQALVAQGRDSVEYGLNATEVEKAKKPSQLYDAEWDSACKNSPDKKLCDALGRDVSFYDLINMKDLLPELYITDELANTASGVTSGE